MRKKVKQILEWFLCIIIAFIIAIIIKSYIATPTIVKQTSMYPTLKDKDRLILNKLTITVGEELERGEIVTFEAPSKKSYPNKEEAPIENPIAIYEEQKGIFYQFFHYVLEIEKEIYIKRIIGLPGEHIEIKEGKVFINDNQLDEPYLGDIIKTTGLSYSYFLDVTIPEDCFFLMGDNRENSIDSRNFGCIPKERIESIVGFRFYPLHSIGKVE